MEPSHGGHTSSPYAPVFVQDATRQLLDAIGEDPSRNGLQETPQRVARSYAEIFGGLNEDPAAHLQKTFEVDTDGLVVVKDIEFYSMCEHHLLPFFGTVGVAYLPSGGQVTGLSKLSRCVDGFARRPQVQERLTMQIAEAVQAALTPPGAAGVVKAGGISVHVQWLASRLEAKYVVRVLDP